MDSGSLIQEKVNEYRVMSAPIERAQEDLALSRRMLHARYEEEIVTLAPALGALAEMLRVSALDMLLAADRVSYLEAAVHRSGLSVDDISRRLIDSSATARDDLRLLGFGESL